MKKNYLLFILSFFILFIPSNAFCKESSHELALKIYTQRIDKINSILKSNLILSPSEYDALRHDVLETITALNAMEKQISEHLNHSTPAEKENLEKTLQNVEELNLVANNILKIVDKKKIRSTLVTYVNVRDPLYQRGTFEKAYSKGSAALKDIFYHIYLSIIALCINSITFPFYVLWISWVILCAILIPVSIWFRKKVTLSEEKTTFLKKIKIFFTSLSTGLIYPVIVLGGIFLIGYFSDSFLFPLREIVTFYLFIAFIWISILFTTLFINPKEFKWGFVHVEKNVAQNLSKNICLFLLFLALRLWFNQMSSPLEFSRYLNLVSQVLLSTQAFFILRVIHINKLIKCALGLIAIVDPILIFVGLGVLANLILSGTLSTIIIFLLLRSLVISIKRLLYYIFKSSNSVLRHAETSEKTSEMIIYWINAFFAILLFLVALYAILLSWGIDHTILNDGVKSVMFGFKVGSHTVSLINIFSAILVFLVLFLLTRYLQGILAKHVFPYTNFDAGLRHAFKTTAGYIGFTIAVILSIKTLGLDLSSILFVLGGLSVGIGLGLQPLVTNFISGVVMLLERPIKIGDQIELGGEIGIVKKINVRTTEIENFEKCSVLYPNSQVINAMVKNWTKNNRMRRNEVSIGVAYGTDTKLVESILLECARKNTFFLKNPAPYVIFSELGNSSLNFAVRAYLGDLDNIFTAGNTLKHDIVTAINGEDIVMAYTQTDVHFDQTFVDAISKNKL